jgi:D-glycero-alpha-D-manno-heptose 1-phosphate guanylyltransferase
LVIPQVVVLAGGLGTRLRHALPQGVPKLLAPVAGRPFLAHLIERFARSGARDFLLLTGESAPAVQEEALAAALEAQGLAGETISLVFSVESEPMGTGGALLLAASRELLADRFVFANGDTLFEADLAPLLVAHEAAHGSFESLATFAATRVDDAGRYGTLATEGWAERAPGERSPAEASTVRLLRFSEKGGDGPGLVSAGVVVIESEVLASGPELAAGGPISFEHDLVPGWLEAGVPLAVWPSGAIFTDIGTESSYADLCGRMEGRAR